MKNAGLLLFVLFVGTGRLDAAQPSASAGRGYGPPRQLGRIRDIEILESSGLTASRTMPGTFWTHNDSGDEPKLYLLDRKGNTVAKFRVTNAKAFDWEDICCCKRGDKHYLLVADVGDNARRRPEVQLYLIEEPVVRVDPDHLFSGRIAAIETIRVRFQDGPHDCESVAFDPVTRDLLLATKQFRDAFVYKVAVPEKAEPRLLTAKKIGRMPIALATAMDVSPDGKRLIVVNYLNGYEYSRELGESWDKAIERAPDSVAVPQRKQGEAVCYDIRTGSLLLTSEGRDGPFWEVPAIRNAADK